MKPSQQQLTNPSFLQKVALDLIKPRKSNYVEDCIYSYFQQSKFFMEDISDLKNKYNHKLKCTFIKHRLTLLQKVQQDFALNQKSIKNVCNQKCIIYLHGLGSNRIEGFSILSQVPKGYSLLTFDLSGSGKSQGDFTTYGLRQKQDIDAILSYLYKHKNIREFIIWGRSMGAVASLLFNNTMAQKQNQTICMEQTPKNNEVFVNLTTLYNCVKCIVADSPFSSFEAISKDIALNKMSIPHFFTDIALKFLQNSFQKILYDSRLKKSFTPFQIDFKKYPLKPVVPIVFVYSLNDEIVNCQHSQNIIKLVEKTKNKLIEKVIIPECGHNLKRPQNVIQAIFQKIQKYCNATKDNKIDFNKKTNRNSINLSTEKREELIKNVKRKSFWNFEQQIQNEQLTSKNQELSQKRESNKFVDHKICTENVTVRKSIFNRDENYDSSKVNISLTKKRGLSLSSTIQRIEIAPHSINANQQTPNKNKNLNQQNGFSSTYRPLSMESKLVDKRIDKEQLKLSPRKGMVRCSGQIINSKFQSKNQQSLGKNINRVSLGGSIHKNPRPTKISLKTSLHCISSNHNSQLLIPAQRDESNPLSMASHSDQTICQSVGSIRRFKTISLNKRNSSIKHVTVQNIESEPNIIGGQDPQFMRVCSRQSFKTIDMGLMKNQVDEGLTSLINNKLEFPVDQTNLCNTVFNKFKTLEIGGPKQKSQSKCKQSLILSEIDIKQMSQFTENTNKISTITIPSHISLRPSSRLYHEKRKKKLQAQNFLFNKQNQNVKITNQRYLLDD